MACPSSLFTARKRVNLRSGVCLLLSVYMLSMFFSANAYAQTTLRFTTDSYKVEDTTEKIIRGRIEFYYDDTDDNTDNGEWRGVCDDYFTDEDAMVACAESGNVRREGRALINLRRTDNDEDHVNNFWLDNLLCEGGEASLGDCSKADSAGEGGGGYGDHNCRLDTEYTGAVCYTEVVKPKAPVLSAAPDPEHGDTAVLSWTAPRIEFTGHNINYIESIVDDYELQVSENGDSGWTDVHTDITSTRRMFSHSGLSSGTWYYRIRAVNSAGNGPYSNVAEVTLGGNGMPVFSEGTSATRSVAENTAAGVNIGDPVTAMGAVSYLLGGTDASSFDIDGTTGQLKTKAALDYETKNSYSVTITAQHNGSAASIDVTISVIDVDESGKASLSTEPEVGTALTATLTDPDIPVSSITWGWEKSTDRNNWMPVGGTPVGDTYTPVAADQTHYLQATATYTDKFKSGQTASVVSDTTVSAAVVSNSPPEFSSATTTRSVREDAPRGSNVGAPVTATDSDTAHQGRLTYSLDSTAETSFSIDSLGQITTDVLLDYETQNTYSVTVTAQDPGGETGTIIVDISVINVDENGSPPINTRTPPQVTNPPQSPSSSPPPVKVPLAPQNLVAMPGNTEVMLEWMAPYDNGSAIKHYEYEMDGGQWTSTGGTSTSYNVTELTNGETYRFRVRAVNSVDSGPPSRQASATPATVPGPPRNLTATPGDQRVTLIWERPADNGGLPITGYQYSQKEEDGSFGRWVPIDDSGPREANETSYTVTGLKNGTVYSFRVRAVNAVGPGDPSAEATAEPSTAEFRRARHASLRILPTFGRTMLRNSVDALTWRLDSVLSGSYERTGMFRLMDQHAGLHEVIGNDIWDDPDEWEALSLEEMLYGSSFIIEAGGMLRKPKQRPKEALKEQVKKYAEEAPGEHIKEDTEEPSPDGNMWIEEEEKPAVIERRGSMGFWGKADYNNLSVTSDEWFSWDGRIVSGYMGVDRWLNEEVLTGLSVSLTEGDFDYTDTTPGVGGRGDYRIRMVSVSPYVSWFLSQDVYLWSAIGYGRGQIDIDDEGASRVATSDLSYKSVAAGGSGRVFDVGDTTFSLKSEAFKVWMDVEGDDYLIDEMSLGVHQLRLSMEGSYEYRFASGTWFNPLVEVALRHDGGDGETGTGIELGGGFLYENPSLGLSISGRGRWLATHSSEDFSQWGLGGAVVFDKGADKRGVLFSVAPEWGDTSSGVDSLWERGVEGLSSEGAGDNDMHLDAEFGYGLAALGGDGLLTPYSGLRLGGDGRQHYRLGSRLDLGRSASLSLETERRQSDTAKPEHGVILRGEVNF